MKALILDNAVDHSVYNPILHWRNFLDIPFETFRASEGQLPEDLSGFTHVIITGSEASIMDDHVWSLNEEVVIRRSVDEGKVVLGSCYGHQLLAKSLFGKSVVRKSETPEIGWDFLQLISHDELLGDAGSLLPVLLIHFDEVQNLPKKDVDIIATTKKCEIQNFKLKGKPVWGMQSHPEISIPEGKSTIEKMIEKAKQEHSSRLPLFLKARESAPKEADWFGAFVNAFQKVTAI